MISMTARTADTFRVAVIHGGRFETAVNPVSSSRKTPSMVGFPDEQRVFAPLARQQRGVGAREGL